MLIQQGDIRLQNELIQSYQPFIARTVSSVCKRYITESDDEFSIGLIAFNEAIENYCHEKGQSLLRFAEVIIRRRVIDYIRNNSINTHLSLENDDSSAHKCIDYQRAIENFRHKSEEASRKEEIIQLQQLLAPFQVRFEDLVNQSPKHADARKNAILVAKTLVEQRELFQLLEETKRLPIKQLKESVKVSRKTIERNRKYIIAVALILNGELIFLKDYIKGVLET